MITEVTPSPVRLVATDAPNQPPATPRRLAELSGPVRLVDRAERP